MDYRLNQTTEHIFKSSNPLGIPDLDPTMDAKGVIGELEVWGSLGAKAKQAFDGTWNFYTDDTRFLSLIQNPKAVMTTQCRAAVEPNFSLYHGTPFAKGLYAIYLKRTIARVWQTNGIKTLVDVSVPPKFFDANLYGVPTSWRGFCTRAHRDDPDNEWLLQQYERVKTHTNNAKNLAFVVYGGGDKVKALAKKHNWQHEPEQVERVLKNLTQAELVCLQSFPEEYSKLFPQDVPVVYTLEERGLLDLVQNAVNPDQQVAFLTPLGEDIYRNVKKKS